MAEFSYMIKRLKLAFAESLQHLGVEKPVSLALIRMIQTDSAILLAMQSWFFERTDECEKFDPE